MHPHSGHLIRTLLKRLLRLLLLFPEDPGHTGENMRLPQLAWECLGIPLAKLDQGDQGEGRLGLSVYPG